MHLKTRDSANQISPTKKNQCSTNDNDFTVHVYFNHKQLQKLQILAQEPQNENITHSFQLNFTIINRYELQQNSSER